MKNIEEIREIFLQDRFATLQTGINIDEIGDKYAKCSFEIKPFHLNGMNAVMGGAIFTLADFSVAVASNCDEINNVSLSCTIDYLGQPKGNKVIAEAKCIKSGRKVSVYSVNIYDNKDNAVAFVKVTSFGVK